MTTNNLIGYDPLAWMDGADIEEDAAPKPEPAKKVTKSRAKAKVETVEAAEIPVVVKDITPEAITEKTVEAEIVEAEEVVENETIEEIDDIEVDVTIDEDGEIEITVDTNKNADLSVHVSIEKTNESADDDDVISAVVDEIAEEITHEEITAEISSKKEDVAMSKDAHIEEAPIGVPAEPHIDLDAESTIKNVAALYDTVKHALDAHDAIEINASDVKAIDTSTLQLLVSLKKNAPNLGKTVDIIYPSARFIESAKLLGLLDILDLAAH
jgi:ABC-type transporter Mla MlaB component